MKPRELLPPSIAGVLLLGLHLMPEPHNGQLAGLPTLCPLKFLTAIPCPGCGITRSLVLFAHGDWVQAFSFHPLGPLFYGLLWLVMAAGVLQSWRKPHRVSQSTFSQRTYVFAGSTIAAALLIVWLVRLSGAVPFPTNF